MVSETPSAMVNSLLDCDWTLSCTELRRQAPATTWVPMRVLQFCTSTRGSLFRANANANGGLQSSQKTLAEINIWEIGCAKIDTWDANFAPYPATVLDSSSNHKINRKKCHSLAPESQTQTRHALFPPWSGYSNSPSFRGGCVTRQQKT